jgi:hypothetical protein
MNFCHGTLKPIGRGYYRKPYCKRKSSPVDKMQCRLLYLEWQARHGLILSTRERKELAQLLRLAAAANPHSEPLYLRTNDNNEVQTWRWQ